MLTKQEDGAWRDSVTDFSSIPNDFAGSAGTLEFARLVGHRQP